MTPRPLLLALLAGLVLIAGCGGRPPDVVLYCAVDQAHSEPIVRAFEERTGLKVAFYPDIEANKSVGHRRRLQEEASNPRCDVFWNNEVVQTVLLAEAGLLDAYASPQAAAIPDGFKDPGHLWTGIGARGRVLIVNTDVFPDGAARPDAMGDFLDPAYAGRAGMAVPLTGTTATHASILIASLGEAATFELLEAMRANEVRFGPGNAQVMRLVRSGELDFGWTDTDDVKSAVDQDFPVAQVIPDQGPEQFGLIVIPNTISLVKGAPNPENARKLIDFLLSPEVEQMLAFGPSAQIPVRADVPRPDDVLDLSRYRLAEVDWATVGRTYADSVDKLEAFFTR